MTNIDITNFEKNIHQTLDQAINANDIIKVSTPNGSAIILAEEDYTNLIETFYFYDIPKMKEKTNEINNQSCFLEKLCYTIIINLPDGKTLGGNFMITDERNLKEDSTFIWNGFRATIVTPNDTWCYFKPALTERPAEPDAPYGYIIEIPNYSQNETWIAFQGTIKRVRIIKKTKSLLLQIISWPPKYKFGKRASSYKIYMVKANPNLPETLTILNVNKHLY